MMIEDINTFCAVAKYQSFSKAARELGLSTPVVTRRLARLESSLEVRLLNRTTRQVTLTEAGNLFFNEVSDVLQALEASKENVKFATSQISGTLRVALPASLNQCYVIPSIKHFLAKYPNLKVEISSGSNTNLLNNGYDLVILCGQLPHSSYHYKKILSMRKVICASPAYLKKSGEPKTLDDLVNHNCLDVHDHFQSYWMIQNKGETREILVRGNVHVNNGVDLKTLAMSDVGIAHLPSYLVYNELQSGELVEVLKEENMTEYAMYAVYASKKYMARKIQAFLDFVTELVAFCGCEK